MKRRYPLLDQLWIASVIASASGFIWIYALPPLAVGTPLKFVVGSVEQPAFELVTFGLVSLGILTGLLGAALSRRRLPAIVATIAGFVTALAVSLPYSVGD